MVQRDARTFFRDLRGSFCGAVYDKKQSVWRFFTDHVGYRPLFITECGKGAFYLSSDLQRVFVFRKQNGLSLSQPKRDYENLELFRLYQREFPALAGVRAGQEEFAETVTPFADVETMEAGLKVPVLLRYNHRFYLKLMCKRHPYAASFDCGRFRASPIKYKEPHMVCICGRRMPVADVLPRVIHKLNPWSKPRMNGSMRPYELWLNGDTLLRRFYDQYMTENIGLLTDSELRKDVQMLYGTGQPREMSMVIGLLSANKLFL